MTNLRNTPTREEYEAQERNKMRIFTVVVVSMLLITLGVFYLKPLSSLFAGKEESKFKNGDRIVLHDTVKVHTADALVHQVNLKYHIVIDKLEMNEDQRHALEGNSDNYFASVLKPYFKEALIMSASKFSFDAGVLEGVVQFRDLIEQSVSAEFEAMKYQNRIYSIESIEFEILHEKHLENLIRASLEAKAKTLYYEQQMLVAKKVKEYADSVAKAKAVLDTTKKK